MMGPFFQQLSTFFPSTAAIHVTSLLIYTFGSVAVIAMGLYIWLWPLRYARLQFKNLPGPTSDHWFWGTIPTVLSMPPNAAHTLWTDRYGPTIRNRWALGQQRFLTIDPVALSFILAHGDLFPKPEHTRKSMIDMLGNGLLVSEGEDHKRQRKALNPSFSPAAVRSLVPIFYDKAYELKAKILGFTEGDDLDEPCPTPPRPADAVKGGRKIDIMKYLAKTTLDIIGLAGFGYDFKSLSEPHNELSDAYAQMFQISMNVKPGNILQAALGPLLMAFPTERGKKVAMRREVTRRIGMGIVQDKKREVTAAHHYGLEKDEQGGHDLLSSLVKANMASDLPPEQRLSDEEVLDQITTFMLAGNETSSSGITWMIYHLAQNLEVQERLREEVLSVPDDRPSLETLHSLSYLEAVVREGLRLCAPAPSTMRVAKEDVAIPLSIPVKGRDGHLMESVRINKGTEIFIPIITVNTSPLFWGPDARTFRPERFLELFPQQKVNVPGVWGNLLTFLGGTRNCIGYRFALAEIKIILFVLIRSFNFEELKSKPLIESKAWMVMRPRVVGEEAAGMQMPLMVQPVAM